jgi:hypothetical protein
LTDPEQAARIAAAVAATGITYGLVVFEVGKLLEARGDEYPEPRWLGTLEPEAVERWLGEIEPDVVVRVGAYGSPRELDELEAAVPDLRDAWVAPELAIDDELELVCRHYDVKGSSA